MTPETTSLFVDHEVIRLTREGIFLSNGEEITHERTVEAYHRFLGRDDESYFIQIGRDFKRIEVEDTAYFVRAVRFEGVGSDEHVTLSLLGGTEERLDPATLAYRDGRLSCEVRAHLNQSRRERALFLRAAHTEFLLRVLEEGDHYILSLGGKKFTIQEK